MIKTNDRQKGTVKSQRQQVRDANSLQLTAFLSVHKTLNTMQVKSSQTAATAIMHT